MTDCKWMLKLSNIVLFANTAQAIVAPQLSMVKSVKQVAGVRESGHLISNRKRRFSPAFQVQNVRKTGLSRSYSFQAGCRGSESRLPLHANSVAMKSETFHG
jgi:hypothetical protein